VIIHEGLAKPSDIAQVVFFQNQRRLILELKDILSGYVAAHQLD
jgi:hypothetical protein